MELGNARGSATADAEDHGDASGEGAMRVEAAAPALPATQCDGRPCWRGLRPEAGALTLFLRPPTAVEPPARVADGELVVEAAFGAEGRARIVVVATDASGQSVTQEFDVTVEFYWPPRQGAGWRGALRPE